MNETERWWLRATGLLALLCVTGELAVLHYGHSFKTGIPHWTLVGALALSSGILGGVLQRLIAAARRKRRAGA